MLAGLQSKINVFYKLASMTQSEAWAHLLAGKPLYNTYHNDTHTVHTIITWDAKRQIGMVLYKSNKTHPREIGIPKEQVESFIKRNYPAG